MFGLPSCRLSSVLCPLTSDSLFPFRNRFGQGFPQQRNPFSGFARKPHDANSTTFIAFRARQFADLVNFIHHHDSPPALSRGAEAAESPSSPSSPPSEPPSFRGFPATSSAYFGRPRGGRANPDGSGPQPAGEVRRRRPFQGGAEPLNQLMRQIADKPDRVGNHRNAVPDPSAAGGGVKGGEYFRRAAVPSAGQFPEQDDFPRWYTRPRRRRGRRLLAAAARLPVAPGCFPNPLLQLPNLPGEQTAVNFNLFLPGSAAQPDSPALPFQMRPPSGEPPTFASALREFHLQVSPQTSARDAQRCRG